MIELTPRGKAKARKETLKMIKDSFAIDTRPTIHVEIVPFSDDLKAADGFTIIFAGATAKLRQKVVGEILEAQGLATDWRSRCRHRANHNLRPLQHL